jgi:hypothetical protein
MDGMSELYGENAAERFQHARAAFELYERRGGEAMIKDLITDLMHIADTRIEGGGPAVLAEAEEQYAAEQGDAGQAPAPRDSDLPQEPDRLWELLADVLQALQEAGEGPKLEEYKDWRINPKDYEPGVRRTADDGRWDRKVAWTNVSGTWRWTYRKGAQ